jgi:hypothetical protein
MNQTDLDLLDLAAKAAGYKKYYSHYLGRDSFVTYDDEYYSEVYERRVVGEKTLDWNPLADDGDALRLAVTLKIDVKHYDDYVVGWFDGGYIGTGRIFYEGDPYAATRRAIVRAAAEIGRNMT